MFQIYKYYCTQQYNYAKHGIKNNLMEKRHKQDNQYILKIA